jgi:hypothetical protein
MPYGGPVPPAKRSGVGTAILVLFGLIAASGLGLYFWSIVAPAPRPTSPTRFAPSAERTVGCDLGRRYLLDYRRTDGAPRLWEQLVTLQGGNADGDLTIMNAYPDAADHCRYRWTGTLNGRIGPRATLTWWYTPATGEIQAADASTRSTPGW